MKIALIGATGYVGAAILKEALDRGHEVTAIVRNPDTLTSHQKLHPAKGDIYNENEVARLVMDHESVISAFNPGWTNPDIYSQQIKGTHSIISGVKKSGVKRLLFVGGAGSLEVTPGVQSVDMPGFPAEYKQGALATRWTCFGRNRALNGHSFLRQPTCFPANAQEGSDSEPISC